MEQNNTTPPPVAGSNGRSLGIAGMIIGIVAIIGSCIPCLNWIAIVPAIVGIILSAISLSQAKKAGASKGMAITGLICSILAILMTIIMTVFVFAAVGAAAEGMKEFQESAAMDSINSAMQRLQEITDTLNNNQ